MVNKLAMWVLVQLLHDGMITFVGSQNFSQVEFSKLDASAQVGVQYGRQEKFLVIVDLFDGGYSAILSQIDVEEHVGSLVVEMYLP